MRKMLHPVGSAMVSPGESRQPVQHSSLNLHRTQATKPWAAASIADIMPRLQELRSSLPPQTQVETMASEQQMLRPPHE